MELFTLDSPTCNTKFPPVKSSGDLAKSSLIFVRDDPSAPSIRNKFSKIKTELSSINYNSN